MTALTITEARKQLYKLVEAVQSSHEPIQLTGKGGDAVLISASDWEAIQETLYLLAIPGMRESIHEGMETPTQEMTQELDW